MEYVFSQDSDGCLQPLCPHRDYKVVFFFNNKDSRRKEAASLSSRNLNCSAKHILHSSTNAFVDSLSNSNLRTDNMWTIFHSDQIWCSDIGPGVFSTLISLRERKPSRNLPASVVIKMNDEFQAFHLKVSLSRVRMSSFMKEDAHKL